jgi:glycosyltransferase involved in cell wall biosynthesis
MRIGIDARLYGPAVGGGGLGRYVEQLVVELQRQDRENRYVLFLKPENADACNITAPNFEKRIVDAHWYTAKEQIVVPTAIDRERLDLVHFPHWNVPLMLRTPFVVTIHDLILLEQPASAKATTRSPAVYALKRLGYRASLWNAINRSQRIIAVSEYTKSSVKRFFPRIDPDKISVIHEGVTVFPPPAPNEPHAPNEPNEPPVPPVPNPYLLYVGNAYPHKNLESLLHAFSFFVRLHPEVKLVLAGRDDIFYKRLQQELDEIEVPRSNVQFVMNPTDEELAKLYRDATLYLFPSRSEGFGLPPLEAMAAGVPVAAARATCLPEILGDAALYFSPDDIEEMVEVMERAVSDETLRAHMIKQGRERVTRYSWSAMAAQTRELYGQIAHRKTE